VISRGNPAIEYVLEHNIPYLSGPEWLASTVLRNRWVLAVAGTHGKTTTSSLLAWILNYAGMEPGFLIGGMPENFGVSARLSTSSFFVIEADEYDSAYFDKRSKFIHYRPKTLILNNLEFDHADIFPDLKAIQQQFHYLVRTVPGNGLIIKNQADPYLTEVLAKGCWTPVTTFSGNNAAWRATLIENDGSRFSVYHQDALLGEVKWELLGNHNVNNALAALAAAEHAGVSAEIALQALAHFKNVKRRLEIKGHINGITLYDDFAHHPTAIATTLAGLRARIGKARLIAVLEFGSYTMRSGVHKERMTEALKTADIILCKRPHDAQWDATTALKECVQPTQLYDHTETLIIDLAKQLTTGDHVVIMSNSGFDAIHSRLLTLLHTSSTTV
jgi:UDP-N-acetylmuramate: L-alanyl-gamma-D-glutamyl-meso-diaminopimelate ligase